MEIPTRDGLSSVCKHHLRWSVMVMVIECGQGRYTTNCTCIFQQTIHKIYLVSYNVIRTVYNVILNASSDKDTGLSVALLISVLIMLLAKAIVSLTTPWTW